ncbi:MAG: hypothetical protein QW582_02250 [Candidatus Micrarchaeaceae archaeon]
MKYFADELQKEFTFAAAIVAYNYRGGAVTFLIALAIGLMIAILS